MFYTAHQEISSRRLCVETSVVSGVSADCVPQIWVSVLSDCEDLTP